MRHVKTIALCLAAAFALSAMATAASASAETLPEVYQCVKAKKEGKTYLGHYNGKKCEESTKVEKGGKYELEPWNAAGKGGPTKVKKFKGKSSPSFLEVHELGPVKCPKGTDEGEFTGPKTVGNIEVTFTKCELNKHPCSNTATAGEIKTNTLKGEIGYYDEEEGKSVARKVGLDLTAQSSAFEAENIQCASINLRVHGSVIGEIAPPYNVFTKEVKLKFRQSNGIQAIQSFEGLEPDFLETESCGVECFTTGESGQSGEATNKGEELELKA